MKIILLSGIILIFFVSQNDGFVLVPGVTAYAVYAPTFDMSGTNFHCSMLAVDPYCRCVSTLVTDRNEVKIGYEEYWLENLWQTRTIDYNKALFDIHQRSASLVDFIYVDKSAILGPFTETVELDFQCEELALFTVPAKRFRKLGPSYEGEMVGTLVSTSRNPNEICVQKALIEMAKRQINLRKMRRISHERCPLNPIYITPDGKMLPQG